MTHHPELIPYAALHVVAEMARSAQAFRYPQETLRFDYIAQGGGLYRFSVVESECGAQLVQMKCEGEPYSGVADTYRPGVWQFGMASLISWAELAPRFMPEPVRCPFKL